MKLPHNLDAEKALLGAMLLDPTAIETADSLLKPEDFYADAHRDIYSKILATFRRGDPVDLVSIASQGVDAAYIAQLADATPTTANAEFYAQEVARHSRLRQTIQIAYRTLQRAQEQDANPDEILDALTKDASLLSAGGTKEITSLFGAAAEEAERIYALKEDDNARTRTGFVDLDKALGGGLWPGELTIIAARPAMGKTSLMRQIAYNNAVEGRSSLTFSLEMTKESLGLTLIAGKAGVSFQLLRAKSKKVTPDDWTRVFKLALETAELPAWVDDSPRMTTADIRSRCRQVKAKKGLDLVLIDYLQLIKGKGNTRNEELQEIAYDLKALAKELKIPVVALSQLSRDVEKRSDKRPLLSDLRESGGIEQAADSVVFLYRDDYYNPAAIPGITEVIIAKSRFGATGVVKLHWAGQHMMFHNLAKQVG